MNSWRRHFVWAVSSRIFSWQRDNMPGWGWRRQTVHISLGIYEVVILLAANSLQSREYQIILSQWGSNDKILQGEIGRRETAFRWEHLLLLWGRRKPRSTFSSSPKLKLYLIWVPPRFHILLGGELKEREGWAPSFLRIKHMPSVWQGRKYSHIDPGETVSKDFAKMPIWIQGSHSF